MDPGDRDALETRLRELVSRGELADAIAAVVRGYGPEIVAYVSSALRTNDADVADVFAMFCEDVCRGLPSFRFDATVRTWAYVVARRACLRHLRQARRRANRFDGPDELEQIAANVRTATLEHLRTTNVDRLAKIRDELDHDARTLLILRVDRGLAWREVALVMIGGESEDAVDAATLRKAEQVARKRYATIKQRIKVALAK